MNALCALLTEKFPVGMFNQESGWTDVQLSEFFLQKYGVVVIIQELE
jgi:hypothetical protein